MMCELMRTKKEEDEFVLQIAHSLASLLACEATRTLLLQSTEVSLAGCNFQASPQLLL